MINTVEDLIKELQRHPQHSRVVVVDSERSYPVKLRIDETKWEGATVELRTIK